MKRLLQFFLILLVLGTAGCDGNDHLYCYKGHDEVYAYKDGHLYVTRVCDEWRNTDGKYPGSEKDSSDKPVLKNN